MERLSDDIFNQRIIIREHHKESTLFAQARIASLNCRGVKNSLREVFDLLQ